LTKALSICLAAENLRDAVGNLYDQIPDEEISKIKALLGEKRIERNLQEFQEHFLKMEELLKTVREIQQRTFGYVPAESTVDR
jgi:hypothetical protein